MIFRFSLRAAFSSAVIATTASAADTFASSRRKDGEDGDKDNEHEHEHEQKKNYDYNYESGDVATTRSSLHKAFIPKKLESEYDPNEDTIDGSTDGLIETFQNDLPCFDQRETTEAIRNTSSVERNSGPEDQKSELFDGTSELGILAEDWILSNSEDDPEIIVLDEWERAVLENHRRLESDKPSVFGPDCSNTAYTVGDDIYPGAFGVEYQFRHLISACYLESLLCPTDSCVSNWDVSKVTDMTRAFAYRTTARMGGTQISNWDTSKVTSMDYMFSYSKYFNSDISEWKTGSVKDMSSMFRNALSFDQAIGKWDTQNVRKMSNMFKYAESFGQSVKDWDTAKVIDMESIFYGAKYFNGDLSKWNTAKVKTMESAFYEAHSFRGFGLENWDTQKVENFDYMFYRAYSFRGKIKDWNTTSATSMGAMFSYATDFNKFIGKWDTGGVTDMSYMFYYAINFDKGLSSWNTARVNNMKSMFAYTTNFNGNLNKWDVSKVTDFSHMFDHADLFQSRINDWNTSKARYMQHMFAHTKYFDTNINKWDVSKVRDFSYMFYEADGFNRCLNNWGASVDFCASIKGMFKSDHCQSVDREKFCRGDDHTGLWCKVGLEEGRCNWKQHPCSNDHTRFRSNGRSLCDWIGSKEKGSEKRLKRCTSNEKRADMCPLLCDKAGEEDKCVCAVRLGFRFLNDFDCQMVWQRKNLCGRKHVTERCPLQCNSKCKCVNDPEFYVGKSEEKNCDWVGGRPEVRCEEPFAIEACPMFCNQECM